MFDDFPYHQSVLHTARGDYVELPGWEEDITGARSLADLPATTRSYLDFIEEQLGIPVVTIGVGPGARPDHLDRGREEPRAGRRGLTYLEAHHVRLRAHVVDRAVLAVPERPQVVQEESGRPG